MAFAKKKAGQLIGQGLGQGNLLVENAPDPFGGADGITGFGQVWQGTQTFMLGFEQNIRGTIMDEFKSWTTLCVGEWFAFRAAQ